MVSLFCGSHFAFAGGGIVKGGLVQVDGIVYWVVDRDESTLVVRPVDTEKMFQYFSERTGANIGTFRLAPDEEVESSAIMSMGAQDGFMEPAQTLVPEQDATRQFVLYDIVAQDAEIEVQQVNVAIDEDSARVLPVTQVNAEGAPEAEPANTLSDEGADEDDGIAQRTGCFGCGCKSKTKVSASPSSHQ